MIAEEVATRAARDSNVKQVRAIAAIGLFVLALDIPGELSIIFIPENPVIAWLARAVDTDYRPGVPGFAFAQAIAVVDILWLMPLYFVACVGLWRLKRWGFFLALACAPALVWNVMTDMATDLIGGFANVRSVPFYLLLWVPYLAQPAVMLLVLWRQRALFVKIRVNPGKGSE